MSLRAVALGTTCLAVLCAAAPVSSQSDGNPVVVIETSVGNITVELFRDKAPLSVANFLSYMEDGFFVNTIFHPSKPGHSGPLIFTTRLSSWSPVQQARKCSTV